MRGFLLSSLRVSAQTPVILNDVGFSASGTLYALMSRQSRNGGQSKEKRKDLTIFSLKLISAILNWLILWEELKMRDFS
jgi:hypothetical protein